MNIKIGAKIKALRKRDNIKQERLAEALGVTSQAISRWESENGYPDIEYITPIANFFNVTIDYLFDHDKEEKRQKIEAYINQANKYRQEKTHDEQIALMRRALAEFPAEQTLSMRLAEMLYLKWSSHGFWGLSEDPNRPDVEKHKSFDGWEEAMKIMEELLASSTDDNIRGQCRYMLANIYGAIGEHEKELAIAEQCGSLYYSKEHILSTITWGDEGIKGKQELLGLLTHILQNILITFPCDSATSIEAHEFLMQFWKFIYRDDYGTWNGQVTLLYSSYANRLFCAKRLDEAIKAFAQAFIHAKNHDTLAGEEGEKSYTSPYANLMTYNRGNFPSPTRVSELLKTLTSDMYQSLHENADFTALVNEVESWVAEQSLNA